jgi:hypothetical protein
MKRIVGSLAVPPLVAVGLSVGLPDTGPLSAAITAASTESANNADPAPTPPTNTVAPTITGTARQGETLTAGLGTWSGSEPISYSYQWRRCDLTKLNCRSITGATAQSYVLTAADAGATIRVRVIATNSAGTTIAPSKGTVPVTPPCPGFQEGLQAGVVNFADAKELSGIAASRRNPGVLWAHNDSGDTERVFAMTGAAAYLGTYTVSPKLQVDWEDMAVGPGPVEGVSYLYLGSIGGNGGRHYLSVYRAPEPEVRPDQPPVSVPLTSVVKLRMKYPGDELHDAEALLVDPHSHDIYVVTKSYSGVAKVFRFPAEAQDSTVSYEMQRVATVNLPSSVTAGDISPDGRDIALKGYAYSRIIPRALNVPVDAALASPQCTVPHGSGEALGFAADGSGYYTIAEGRFRPLFWFARKQ